MKKLPNEFLTGPIVYAVKNSYQIIVPVRCETVMWVRVGEQNFYDDSNGILRSASSTHKMIVPMELLDREKKYTVCYRVINKRKPYFTESGEVQFYESAFRPIEKEPIHIYHIADAHNRVEEPVAAGAFFGDSLDLLILNGDIPNHSDDISYFATIHQIAYQLTQGEIPVVFSRGNHDTRGIYAEQIADHTPTDQGRSYFTFRLGQLWGLVLDCGEDKPDDHAAYGNTICCHDFRLRQTAFLKELIANASAEYEADGVKNRIVIVHNPFTQTFKEPFDIEQELFSEWAVLLKEHVKPQLMLCGHVHKAYIAEVGGACDHKGQPCPVIVASETSKTEDLFVGGALTLFADQCRVIFNDQNKNVLLDQTLSL